MKKDNTQAYEELNKLKIEVAKMLDPNYNYDYYNKKRRLNTKERKMIKMKVYAVVAYNETDECSNVLGVYSTKENAEKAISIYKEQDDYYDTEDVEYEIEDYDFDLLPAFEKTLDK